MLSSTPPASTRLQMFDSCSVSQFLGKRQCGCQNRTNHFVLEWRKRRVSGGCGGRWSTPTPRRRPRNGEDKKIGRWPPGQHCALGRRREASDVAFLSECRHRSLLLLCVLVFWKSVVEVWRGRVKHYLTELVSRAAVAGAGNEILLWADEHQRSLF